MTTPYPLKGGTVGPCTMFIASCFSPFALCVFARNKMHNVFCLLPIAFCQLPFANCFLLFGLCAFARNKLPFCAFASLREITIANCQLLFAFYPFHPLLLSPFAPYLSVRC